MPDHPVAQLLKQVEQLRRFAATTPSEGPFANYTGITIQPHVIEHGRPFAGIKRPKGYRRRAAKQCFQNAALLAIEGRGTYVEGYAAPLAGNLIIEHAWVTVDNIHAVDVTWVNPERAAYFGVPIPSTVLLKLLCERSDVLSPLKQIVFGK
jgi:hypothetical protein